MRLVNRLGGFLLGLILLGLGLAIVVQTVSALASRPWPVPRTWRGELASVEIADRRVLWISLGVAVVGLLALVAQLVPRRQARLLASVGERTWWVSRRSVEHRSVAAATVGGGAHAVKASARGRPDQWQVRIAGEAPPHRHAAVERAVREELATLGAPDSTRISLALRQPGRVA